MRLIKYIFIISFSMCSLYVLADTHYSRTNGNWNVAGTWSTTACGGAAAASAPATTDNVVICSGYTITNPAVVTTIRGITIQSGGTLVNNGEIRINLGTVTNGGTFTNNGNVYVGYASAVTFNNNNIYTNNGFTQLGRGASSTFNNGASASFSITTIGQLYVYWGTFSNGGTLTNNRPISSGFCGIIIDAATLTTTNSLTNNGTLLISAGILNVNGGTLTNNDTIRNYSTSAGSGQININSGGVLNNNCKIHNSFYNTSIFSFITINSGGTLTNNGTVKNLGGYMDVYGTLTNNGTYLEWGFTRLQNGSNFTNNANRCIYTDTWLIGGSYYIGIIYIKSGGTLTNNGTIQNNSGDYDAGPPLVFNWFGIYTDGLGGTIINNDTLNNISGGIMDFEANATFTNNGIINENGYAAFDGSNCNLFNYGIYNENLETWIQESATITNKSGANINIGSSGVFNINGSSTGGIITVDNGSTLSNQGTGTVPGLLLAISTATVTNNGTVVDQGKITNNGVFTNNNLFDYYMTTGSITGSNDIVYGTSGTLKYHGSIAQTTSHWEFPSGGVPYVIIDNSNSSGVTLDAGKVITGSSTPVLTLTTGPLNLNSSTLEIQNPAGAAISRSSGYILSSSLDQGFNSKVQWNIGSTAGAHEFPFGIDASTYIPFTFDLAGGGNTGGNVTVSTYPTGGSTATDVYNNRPTMCANLEGINTGSTAPANAAYIVKRFWRIEPTSNPITGNATVTFKYGSGEVPLDGDDPGNMVAQRYNTSTNLWDLSLLGGDGTSYTVTVTGQSTFSPWAISKKTSPLPVELLNFTAKCNEGTVDINWSTASETNSDYFNVERSKNNVEWDPVAKINAAGNSNTLLYYSTQDNEPYEGLSYYRLKQVDFDGQYEIYGPVATECVNSTENSINIINTAFNETHDQVTVTYYVPQDGKVDIYIINDMGQIISNESDMANAGLNMSTISLRNTLAIGLYMVTVQGNSQISTQKIYIH